MLARGFRQWDASLFAADEWRVASKLTLQLGVRWRGTSAPSEVNGMNSFPYPGDWNNLAPQAGLAWNVGGGVVRASWGLFFGEIFPASYQQIRFNPPWNVKVIVNDPDLLNPLAGINIDPGNAPRGILYGFAPDLVTPYSNIYGLSWERSLSRRWSLQAGYVGSRSSKLLLHWYENRAQLEPGIPATTATINDRRPDERYLDIRRVVNSGRAYFDAARVTITGRSWRGLSLEASYWFSKNIDTGSDYLNTAYDMDSFRGMSQTQAEVNRDLRGLSRFDQPHAFLGRFTYTTARTLSRWWRDWEAGAVVLFKSGTPFNITTGSDAPGFGNVDGANGDRRTFCNPGSWDGPSAIRTPRSNCCLARPSVS